MTIKVIEEKPVPRQQVACKECGSTLEYGNADLIKRVYHPCDGELIIYHIKCPVCGI